MFIQTEQTPNPATLKFLPGVDVLGRGAADFPDSESAVRSPLAQSLFAVDGVTGVFLGADFITITKDGAKDWYMMKPLLLGAIMNHFSSGRPVMSEAAGDGHEAGDADDEVVAQIKELLDTRVRPAVAQDGGDITFHGFDKGIVYVSMKGSCSGCPSSTATLKAGIENMLRHYIPEVQEVRAVR